MTVDAATAKALVESIEIAAVTGGAGLPFMSLQPKTQEGMVDAFGIDAATGLSRSLVERMAVDARACHSGMAPVTGDSLAGDAAMTTLAFFIGHA